MLSATESSTNHWLASLHSLEAPRSLGTDEGASGPRRAAQFRPDNQHPMDVQTFWTAFGSEIQSVRRNSSEEAIRFRCFQMFPGARLLLRDGRPVEIGGRAFDLLAVLLASRGSVVTKEEIFRHVWPSTVVEESNLRWQMLSLRKALGEDRDLIKTIPGRGYLFAADWEEAGSVTRGLPKVAPPISAPDLDDPSEDSSDDPPATDGPVVVIIDDDQSVREGLDGLLRSVGRRVKSFASVEAFMESGPPSPPCCLILDVWLSGQNGLDFQARLVRAKINLPLIFISGYADVAMSVRAMKAGAVEFLTKPVRHEELLRAVDAAIESSIQRDQLEGRKTAA